MYYEVMTYDLFPVIMQFEIIKGNSYQKGRARIPLIGLNLPFFVVPVQSQYLDFQHHLSWLLFVFSELR
jgi:hypothetical protein